MNQAHFIAMWKSFYDIFIEHKREQEAYHSIVKVGTLLISLGDAGKFHQNNPTKKETGGDEASAADPLGGLSWSKSKISPPQNDLSRPTTLSIVGSNSKSLNTGKQVNEEIDQI